MGEWVAVNGSYLSTGATTPDRSSGNRVHLYNRFKAMSNAFSNFDWIAFAELFPATDLLIPPLLVILLLLAFKLPLLLRLRPPLLLMLPLLLRLFDRHSLKYF